jgi:hypothetical protein
VVFVVRRFPGPAAPVVYSNGWKSWSHSPASLSWPKSTLVELLILPGMESPTRLGACRIAVSDSESEYSYSDPELSSPESEYSSSDPELPSTSISRSCACGICVVDREEAIPPPVREPSGEDAGPFAKKGGPTTAPPGSRRGGG